MHFVTFVYEYDMHRNTKLARLIVVCKRTLIVILLLITTLFGSYRATGC